MTFHLFIKVRLLKRIRILLEALVEGGSTWVVIHSPRGGGLNWLFCYYRYDTFRERPPLSQRKMAQSCPISNFTVVSNHRASRRSSIVEEMIYLFPSLLLFIFIFISSACRQTRAYGKGSCGISQCESMTNGVLLAYVRCMGISRLVQERCQQARSRRTHDIDEAQPRYETQICRSGIFADRVSWTSLTDQYV